MRIVRACRRWVWGGVLTFVLLAPGSGGVVEAWAQGATEDPQQLKEELDKARREIERLKAENERLRGVPSGTAPAPAISGGGGNAPIAAPSPAPVVARPVEAGSVPGTVTVPAPLPEGELVAVERLLADYRGSALAGDARYKGRRFRVEGTVRSFKKVFVTLGWTIELEAEDQLGLVRCAVSFPGISDFQPDPNQRVLEGRRPFRPWQTLLRVGETVVLEGECQGTDGAVIVMKSCRPAG